MVIAILIILGICLGSFINAFVWRHYRRMEIGEEIQEVESKKGKKAAVQALKEERAKLSIVKGRSICTHCGHTLGAKDLVPIFSYVWLHGKCRYCKKRINDTPLAELLTPLLFVVSYLFWPLAMQGAGQFTFILWLVFLVGFVALLIYDLRWFLLPHSIVLPLIGLAALQVLVLATVFGGGVTALLTAFWGALIIGGLFYALYRVSKEQWIGGGDITLGVLLGLLVGGPGNALLVIFLASLLGTLVAISLLTFKKAGRGTHLPFGPFLILAAVITMLWGSQIVSWYTGLYHV